MSMPPARGPGSAPHGTPEGSPSVEGRPRLLSRPPPPGGGGSSGAEGAARPPAAEAAAAASGDEVEVSWPCDQARRAAAAAAPGCWADAGSSCCCCCCCWWKACCAAERPLRLRRDLLRPSSLRGEVHPPPAYVVRPAMLLLPAFFPAPLQNRLSRLGGVEPATHDSHGAAAVHAHAPLAQCTHAAPPRPANPPSSAPGRGEPAAHGAVAPPPRSHAHTPPSSHLLAPGRGEPATHGAHGASTVHAQPQLALAAALDGVQLAVADVERQLDLWWRAHDASSGSRASMRVGAAGHRKVSASKRLCPVLLHLLFPR